MAPPRRSARRSTRSAAQREPTPVSEPSDSEMKDAPSEAATPQDLPPEEPDDDAADDAADDGGDEEDEQETSLPPPSPEPELSPKRSERMALPAPLIKRRPGRPPKYPRPQIDGSDGGSDGTPRRGRGGFRGGRGFGGGRWKNKNLQKQQAMPTDNEGNQLELENDEAKLPEDPEGELKVDKDGRLKGGREYRVRTFTIQGKENRLYMLSTEPARCIGFRDSYLFFQKHKMLYKILLTDDDKMDLIERDLMPHSYKGRSIGVVTARSVFREFGAPIIIGGRKITDDYRVADMRAEGAVEGELAVPDDILPRAGEEYNRNQYVAWHGASQVYHVPTLPVPGAKIEPKKRKVIVTNSNWMLEHAREASRFNSFLAAARKDTNDGVYDIFTNEMHYPAIMQPTHARWVQVEATPELTEAPVDPIEAAPPHLVPNGDQADYPNGEASPRPHHDSAVGGRMAALPKESSTIFPPVSDYQRRNFATVDTEYVSPLYSGLGRPGDDAAARRLPGEGQQLSNIPQDQIDLLPPECRAAFEEAKADEQKWATEWTNEASDGLRRQPDIRYRPA